MMYKTYYMKRPECDLADCESLIAYMLENDLYDVCNNVLLIGDVSQAENDEPVLNGVMVCGFDPTDHEDDLEALSHPVEWALANVPAPGALGAPERMGLIDVDTFIDYVAADPAAFACANIGFSMGYRVADAIMIV